MGASWPSDGLGFGTVGGGWMGQLNRASRSTYTYGLPFHVCFFEVDFPCRSISIFARYIYIYIYMKIFVFTCVTRVDSDENEVCRN
jgi:hypothetical protein